MENIPQPNKLEESKALLRAALTMGSLDHVLMALTAINDYLIGKGTLVIDKSTKSELQNLFSQADGFVKVALGDGGLSRLLIEKENGEVEIMLGDVATDDVKNKWNN